MSINSEFDVAASLTTTDIAGLIDSSFGACQVKTNCIDYVSEKKNQIQNLFDSTAITCSSKPALKEYLNTILSSVITTPTSGDVFKIPSDIILRRLYKTQSGTKAFTRIIYQLNLLVIAYKQASQYKEMLACQDFILKLQTIYNAL